MVIKAINDCCQVK